MYIEEKKSKLRLGVKDIFCQKCKEPISIGILKGGNIPDDLWTEIFEYRTGGSTGGLIIISLFKKYNNFSFYFITIKKFNFNITQIDNFE